jgi:hypothetical protein
MVWPGVAGSGKARCGRRGEAGTLKLSIAAPLAALVVGLSPTNAQDKLKYLLQCGAAKTVPPDSDSDPIFQTRIAKTATGELYIRHFAASGERYDRNSQYRDLKFWSEGLSDSWSGVAIKRPDWTMVGRVQVEKTRRWVEYIEKLYRGGKLESTTTSVCCTAARF